MVYVEISRFGGAAEEVMNELADELKRLRAERRIGSQDALAELSGVAAATIKKIEAGTTSETRPSTLRLLARGLATDPDGTRDPDRAEAIYTRLMQAAGFLPRSVEPVERPVSREEWIEQLAQRLGRTDLAVAMSTVAWDYDKITPAHQRLIEAALLALIEDGPEDRSRKRR